MTWRPNGTILEVKLLLLGELDGFSTILFRFGFVMLLLYKLVMRIVDNVITHVIRSKLIHSVKQFPLIMLKLLQQLHSVILHF